LLRVVLSGYFGAIASNSIENQIRKRLSTYYKDTNNVFETFEDGFIKADTSITN
jgi:hypothetical protein